MTRDDPFYPLARRSAAPPPRTPGGPPIYLGGQGPRGIRLAARVAAGWLQPGNQAGDAAVPRREARQLVAALEAEGRDPAAFDIVGQVGNGLTAAAGEAVAAARGLSLRGDARHPRNAAGLGPAGLDDVVAEFLVPLRDATA